MKYIHARHTPDGTRYRVWTTVSDSYMCPPLTEEELLAWFDGNISMRGIEHAKVHGSSHWTPGEENELQSCWWTEFSLD